MTSAYDPKRPAGIDVNFNDAVAFFVELVALAILAIWAWRLFPDQLVAQTLAAVIVVAVVAVTWGLFAAPKARVQSLPASIAVKFLVLGGSVLAAHAIWANLTFTIVWAVIVVINTAATYIGPYARHQPPPPPPAVTD